jgi:hypothetical protein
VQGDQCPVTLYAFKNELSPTETGFNTNIDTELRKKVLKQISRSGALLWQSILKWILLAFVAVSLIFATRQLLQITHSTSQNDLIEILGVSEQAQLQIVLFHNKKRCFQCEQMERFTAELLQNSYREQMQKKSIVFNTIVIDDPKNQEIVDHFGIFSSTVVLMSFEDNKLENARVLYDLIKVYQEEAIFKTKLNHEVEQFIGELNE